MYLLATLAVAICCAAPLVVGAALTAGVATVLAVLGLPALALAVAATGIVVGRWSRRRRRARLAATSGGSRTT